MNGQGKLLTHYLKNADKLIIPVYQRNYDWREEHCRKLYQDLVRTIRDRKRWHFFGGIVSVIWNFISYPASKGNFVATTQGVNSWWSRYGETAMEIITQVICTDTIVD